MQAPILALVALGGCVAAMATASASPLTIKVLPGGFSGVVTRDTADDLCDWKAAWPSAQGNEGGCTVGSLAVAASAVAAVLAAGTSLSSCSPASTWCRLAGCCSVPRTLPPTPRTRCAGRRRPAPARVTRVSTAASR